MSIKATDFLRRIYIGEKDGKPVYTRRRWRGFFIALIAGGRPVVLNANFKTGAVLPSNGAIIAGCNFEWDTGQYPSVDKVEASNPLNQLGGIDSA